MARRNKSLEDTESILARLRRESFSIDDMPGEDHKKNQSDDVFRTPAHKTKEAAKKDRPSQSAAELLQDLLADEENRSERLLVEKKKAALPYNSIWQRLFEKWLSPEGRMGQKLFILHFIASLFITVALVALVMGAAAALLSWLGAGRGMPSEKLSLAAGFAAVFFISVPLALLLLVFLRAAMRRWHDLGYGDTAWLLIVVAPLLLLALAAKARILLLYLDLAPLLGIAADHFLLASPLPYVGAALTLLVLLHLYLFFAEEEFSDNASGTLESGQRLQPDIVERPLEDYPFFLRMLQLNGRINRKRFLLRWLFILFFICLLLFVLLETAERLTEPLGFAVALYGTAAVFALAAILPIGIVFQRLHDIGQSGWLAGVPLVLTLSAISYIAFWGGDLHAILHEPFGLLIIAAFFLLEIYTVALFAALVFIKGSTEPNTYGKASLLGKTENTDKASPS